MRDQLVEMLRCVAPAGEAAGACCGGRLARRGARSLACAACGAEYPIERRVPRLLAEDAPRSLYDEDFALQVYLEMHFGPYLHGPALAERWTVPQAGNGSGLARPPAASFAELRQLGRLRSRGGPGGLYEGLAALATSQAPTEEFYQAMLDLCAPHLAPGAAVLDVGCAMGRMVAELSERGAARAVGVDLSPRMLETAAELLAARQPVAVRLHLASGRTIGATLDLPFRRDVDLVAADAGRLPLADALFDLVLCVNLVDRVGDPRQVLAECGRVLRPGGRLLVSDPYDWEVEAPAPPHQPADLAQLLRPGEWRWVEEVDGVPFLLRDSQRKLMLFLNHCIVCEKIG
jgi:SAM-dependent methyltransferase